MTRTPEGGDMRNSVATKLARVTCFILTCGATWLVCSVDATLMERVAIASPSQQAEQAEQLDANPPPLPQCDGIKTKLYAHHRTPGGPDWLTEYTVSFPALPAIIPTSQHEVREYEQLISTRVQRANGFEYRVSPLSQGGRFFFGVGVNDASTNPPRSARPPVNNSEHGSPTPSDWNESLSLAKAHTAPPVEAHDPPFTCVGVYAADGTRAGELLDFYAEVLTHDPDPGGW
jgi:hypothetical protein